MDMQSVLPVFDKYYAGLPSLEVQREAKYINACREVFDKESSISGDVVCMAELNVNERNYDSQAQDFDALVREEDAKVRHALREKQFDV